MVGLHRIVEVEREERGAESRPEQTEEQKGALVTPSLVLIEEEQPQLQVHRHKEACVQSRVEDGEAELDRREDGGEQGHRQGGGGGAGVGVGCEWSVHRRDDGITEPSSFTLQHGRFIWKT